MGMAAGVLLFFQTVPLLLREYMAEEAALK
jgi:hypothetical protein